MYFCCVFFLITCRSTQIKTYSWDNAQVVLAGNKCDMEEERVVSVDNGRLLAEQLGGSQSNISALGVFKTGLHHSLVFPERPLTFICFVQTVKVVLNKQKHPTFILWSLIGHFYILIPRFRVFWDKRQGQHQREADLWASRRPNLRQDVWEFGRWSGCHHGSAHCQTHRQRSTPPAARLQLLVSHVREQESSTGPVRW